MCKGKPLLASEEQHNAGGSPVFYVVFHMAAMQVGPVLLSQPSAFVKCGLLGSLLVLGFVCCAALVTSHTVSELWLHCKPLADARSQDRTLDYFDLAELTVGPIFRKVCLGFQMTFLLGTAFGQIVGIGQTLYLVCGRHVDSIWFVLAAGPLCSLVSLVPDFHHFIWFSIVAVCCTLYVSVVILYVSLNEAPVEDFVEPEMTLPTFFQGSSMVVFTFCGQVIQPTIQASLRRPSQMFKGYCWSFLISMAAVVPCGLVAASTFGAGITGNVLYSLDRHANGSAMKRAFVSSAGVAMVGHMLVAYGIFVLPVAMYVEQTWFAENKRGTGKRAVLRLGMTAGLTFLAVMAPFFADIQALMGAVSGSMLSFVFPFLMYQRMFWSSSSRSLRALHIFIIVAMFFGAFLAGTASCVKAIVEHARTYSLFPMCFQC